MKKLDFTDLDRDIALARIILSVVATISVYIDPTTAGGMFHLEPLALAVLASHLGYSVAIYVLLLSSRAVRIVPPISAAFDLFFATAVAFVTEGQTSPSYVFFVFAIIAVAMRGGLRATIAMTASCVGAYLAVTALSNGILIVHVMRVVYLAMAGSLGGYLGHQRAMFERRVHELEARAQRESIARSLHDGYLQSLSGISLRLQSCKELLAGNRSNEVQLEIEGLRASVQREYDTVRAYLRSLAGAAPPRPSSSDTSDIRVRLEARLETRGTIVEEVLNIMLEALRNARRHSAADRIEMDVRVVDDSIAISIRDDGIGFPASANPPWTIASRVAELGGRVNLSSNGTTHLEVEIPNPDD